ncbi:MAG: hypothetical protein WA931_05120 [Rhodococcus sp. (in: high G+C Gram-positive bacteria)]
MPNTTGGTAMAGAVDRLSRASDDQDLHEMILRWRSPVTTAVSGRPGAGKSSVITALTDQAALMDQAPLMDRAIPMHLADLSAPVEMHGVDDPRCSRPVLDHDVLFHVVARTISAADREVLGERGDRDTLVVVGRTDLGMDAPDYARVDDATELARWWSSAVERVLRRRDVDLARDVERLAAGAVDARVAVETFLREAAVADLRRGARS